MGNIAGSGFSSLYQLLESQIKVPGFAIHLPDGMFNPSFFSSHSSLPTPPSPPPYASSSGISFLISFSAVTALNPTVKFYPQYIGFGVDFKFNSENEKGGGEEEQKDWIKNSVGQAIAIN